MHGVPRARACLCVAASCAYPERPCASASTHTRRCVHTHTHMCTHTHTRRAFADAPAGGGGQQDEGDKGVMDKVMMMMSARSLLAQQVLCATADALFMSNLDNLKAV